MEARLHRLALCMVLLACALVTGSVRAQHMGRFEAHSPNFIVFAHSDQMARAVSVAAEKQRTDLAKYWLGQELPAWSMRCPIYVTAGPRLGAGGETRFTLMSGQVGNWSMHIQGTPERILDSVLPHELTHTILASYFAPLNKHVPRWADEGACTTVEHASEKKKHNDHLVQFLRTGRGISFNRMFSLKDYPRDILPLYAQGHSVVQFLIDQGGPRQFIAFLEDGMRSDDWEGAVGRTYKYETLGNLKQEWNRWVADGRPDVVNYSPLLRQTALAQSGVPARTVATPDPRSQLALNDRAGRAQDPAISSVAKVGNDSWYRRQLLRGTVDPVASTHTVAPTQSATQASVRNPIHGSSVIPMQQPNIPHALDARAPAQTQVVTPLANQSWGQPQAVNGVGPIMVPLADASAIIGNPNAIWR